MSISDSGAVSHESRPEQRVTPGRGAGKPLPASAQPVASLWKKEIPKLEEIFNKWEEVGTTHAAKKKRLETLLKNEARLKKLVESASPEMVEADRKALCALCCRYMKMATDEYIERIKSCKTIKQAVQAFEKALPLFERFSNHKELFQEGEGETNLFDASVNDVVEAFRHTSKTITSTRLGSHVGQLQTKVSDYIRSNNRDAALALYQTMKLETQLLQETDLRAAHALNQLIGSLNGKFKFTEALLADTVQKLGVAFKPIAPATSKTRQVAQYAIPISVLFLQLSHAVLTMRAEGKSPQEILFNVVGSAMASGLAREVTNYIVDNTVPARFASYVKEPVNIALSAVVFGMVAQACTSKTITGQNIPTYPMTALNATREVAVLPTCPRYGPQCDLTPPPLGFTNITTPRPPIEGSPLFAFWSKTSGAAGRMFSEMASFSREAMHASVGITAVYPLIKRRIGLT